MIIGARQLGLAILMHDAAHNALSPHRKFNEILSDFFCAYPLLARTDAYRRYHLQHHMRTQQKTTPILFVGTVSDHAQKFHSKNDPRPDRTDRLSAT